MNEIESRLRFIIEADQLKTVLRRTLLADGSRRENDAEHSWHLALCALVLADYAPPGTDIGKVLALAAVHDLVEIYAGDTFAYDEEGYKDKAEREAAAADRLFGALPNKLGAELRGLWEEFEAEETNEALFAAAADRLQPFLNNLCTDGHTWKSGDINLAKVLRRLDPVRRACPGIWEHVKGLAEKAVADGLLKP